jgi:glycerate 2-kinase
MDPHARRELLEQLYRETLRRLNPGGTLMRSALSHSASYYFRSAARRHLIAIGKASAPMANAVEAWCNAHALPLCGGICVSHDPAAVIHSLVHPSVHAPFQIIHGDHPTPGAQSLAAAEAIGRYVETEVRPGDHVVVLLSGGTSALIGAPRAGISAELFARCNDELLGNGMRIDEINAVRRRLSRWGDGRLGDAIQDRDATAEVFLISDVLRGGYRVVGSGPCIALAREGRDDGSALGDDLWPPATLSPLLRDVLAAADSAAKPLLQSALERKPINHTTVSDSLQAMQMVAKLARERGAAVQLVSAQLTDDVAVCAATVSRALLAANAARRAAVATPDQPTMLIWCGEPTVMLPPHGAPAGGRMQALALLVAQALDAVGDDARGISLLAAGTDGRDGATDAAGAVISGDTWRAIVAAGRSPEHDVAAWESTAALRAVGALIPAFSSGTNVNDLIVGLVS